MAWQTTSIYASNPAVISEKNPSQHYTVGNTVDFGINDKTMLMKFALPASLHDKKINSENSYIYVLNSATLEFPYVDGWYYILKEDYDAETVTYIDRPRTVWTLSLIHI